VNVVATPSGFTVELSVAVVPAKLDANVRSGLKTGFVAALAGPAATMPVAPIATVSSADATDRNFKVFIAASSLRRNATDTVSAIITNNPWELTN